MARISGAQTYREQARSLREKAAATTSRDIRKDMAHCRPSGESGGFSGVEVRLAPPGVSAQEIGICDVIKACQLSATGCVS
jgi:hypothetical protein